ncbi:MAG: DUF4136 domain-containing protein [Rhodoferax sp.]|nr:DUF4136 domain-containing protein [Rhodoferax sp.]
MNTQFRATILVLAAVLALGGCAGARLIDSDVQSFVGAAAPARPASYRFERLPSQGDAAEQSRLEDLAAVALAKVELTPAPLVSGAIAGTAAAAPTARYAVQLSVQVLPMVSPYDGAFYGGIWGHRRPWSGFGFGLAMEPTWYRHAVRIVLRDSSSGQVAYETSASFDGPWADSANLLPVLLDAALRDYPNPPAGPHKVVTELPGATPAAP